MAIAVDVSLNTAIADLDEALRALLRRELSRHGFDDVDIAFDAPGRDWSSRLTRPAVNLFLYDLREARARAAISLTERRTNGAAVVTPPPLQLALTYAVTAWAKAVEDEHRLLSQVLAVLFSYKHLPADLFRTAGGASWLAGIETSVGRPREDKADFWTSVGGQYKASIDYSVHISLESGAAFHRGPEVRSQTVRIRRSGGPPGSIEESHQVGGTVRDDLGHPLSAVWVAVPDIGLWTATDDQGRFRFAGVLAGELRILARAEDGREVGATTRIPGPAVDLVIGHGRDPASDIEMVTRS